MNLHNQVYEMDFCTITKSFVAILVFLNLKIIEDFQIELMMRYLKIWFCWYLLEIEPEIFYKKWVIIIGLEVKIVFEGLRKWELTFNDLWSFESISENCCMEFSWSRAIRLKLFYIESLLFYSKESEIWNLLFNYKYLTILY